MLQGAWGCSIFSPAVLNLHSSTFPPSLRGKGSINSGARGGTPFPPLHMLCFEAYELGRLCIPILRYKTSFSHSALGGNSTSQQQVCSLVTAPVRLRAALAHPSAEAAHDWSMYSIVYSL